MASATRSRTRKAARSSRSNASSMPLSQSRLMNSIISTGPPGKALTASEALRPASLAPARMAAPVQPSKGTWRSVAARSLALVFSIDIGRHLDVARKLVGKGEQGQIGHAVWVKDTVQVIAFMLDDPRVEALSLALDPAAVEAQGRIADGRVTRHQSGQPWYRQACLQPERLHVGDRHDLGI